MRTWVTVACLAKTKNLSGGLIARSVKGLPFLLSPGSRVAFVPPQHDAPRFALVESVKKEGHDSYFITFEGVDSIDVAELLAGCHCLMRREDVPVEVLLCKDHELIGYVVCDVRSDFTGRIADVLENPGQTLISVICEKTNKEILIPFVDAFVVDFDEEACCVKVALPEGLLNL